MQNFFNTAAYMLTTGDFPGYDTAGFEEDSLISTALLVANDLITVLL